MPSQILLLLEVTSDLSFGYLITSTLKLGSIKLANIGRGLSNATLDNVRFCFDFVSLVH